jgi:hypothetical protein
MLKVHGQGLRVREAWNMMDLMINNNNNNNNNNNKATKEKKRAFYTYPTLFLFHILQRLIPLSLFIPIFNFREFQRL